MRHAAQAPESLVTFLALVLVGFGHGSQGAIGAAAALLGATLSICVLPGYFLAGVLARITPAAWPERWMMAVGFSLFLIECACIAALTLHVSLHAMALAIATTLVPLAIFRLWRPAKTEIASDAAGSDLRRIALTAWIVTAALAYAIGNLSLVNPGENLLNIGIADALRTALRPQDAFYVNDVHPVYPFPGLNYGYALVADLSGLSSLFVFEKMRFLWTLTATAALFVGVRALSGAVSYAYMALLGGAVLILSGPFGQVLEFYWGQLATTSHVVDVEMNVIVPIALSCLFLWLSPFERNHRTPAVLFACMALLLSAIHQRELVQLLVYAGCALLVLRGRKPSIMLGLAILPALCGVFAYRAWATAYAPSVGYLMSATAAFLLEELHKLNVVTAFRPMASRVIFYDFSFLYGLNALMLIATGIVLVRRRYLPAVQTCGLAVAAFCVSTSFAIVAIPILWVTYDELFYVPVRHIIFVMYCCSCIAFGGLLSSVRGVKPGQPLVSLDGLTLRYHWPFSSGLATVLAVAAAAALAMAARMLGQEWGQPPSALKGGLVPAEILVIALSICGLSTLIPSRTRAEPPDAGGPALPLIPSLAALGTLALLTVMPRSSLPGMVIAGPVGLTPHQVLRIEFNSYIQAAGAREGECHSAKAKLLGREIQYQSCVPPLRLVEWLADNAPHNGVLLLNPLGVFISTGLVPMRVAAPPSFQYFRSWEEAFPRLRQVMECTLERFGGMPFFAPEETPEQRYADARALGATLVLADPATHDLAMNAVRARPDLFRILLDQSEWLLLGLRPDGSTGETPSCPKP